MKKYGFKQYLYLVFGFIVVASTVAYIVLWKTPYEQIAVYSYAVGAVGFVVARALNLTVGADKRIRRLRNIQLLASLLVLGAGYLMWKGSNAWAVALFLAAAFDLIVAYRMPKEEEK